LAVQRKSEKSTVKNDGVFLKQKILFLITKKKSSSLIQNNVYPSVSDTRSSVLHETEIQHHHITTTQETDGIATQPSFLYFVCFGLYSNGWRVDDKRARNIIIIITRGKRKPDI
jgi:hypothetical protein